MESVQSCMEAKDMEGLSESLPSARALFSCNRKKYPYQRERYYNESNFAGCREGNTDCKECGACAEINVADRRRTLDPPLCGIAAGSRFGVHRVYRV